MKQSKINALVLGLFILLIMLPPARAQDSENCTLIGRWPNGPCNTTFIVGSFAYIGNGGAMDILDISDVNAPVRVGQVVTPSVVEGIFVASNYAYLADGTAGLRIIDVSTPSSPVEVGFFDTEDYARDVYVKNSYAYLADQYDGLRIIDVSSPASPTEVGFLETGGTAREVFVQGNYAYLADYFNLYIIDISTPSSPTEVGSLRIGWAFGVYVQDNFAYVANWYDGLSIIDISTPSSPTEVGSFDTGGYALSVYVRNNYAYLADGTGGLRIFNVSTPSSPTEIGHFDEGGNARAVFVQEDYAYIANFYDGLLILDVSTPSSPGEVVSVETGGKARAIYVLNNYAYLASNHTGLNIFDISTPSSPAEVGFLKTGDFAYDIHVVGNYAYLVDLYLGLRIIDVSTPLSPTEVGFLDTGDHGRNVYVQDNYAYIADKNSGLHIIDVSTPDSPIEVGSFDPESPIYDVSVRDNYAYVADGMEGLRIIDISTPSSPTEVGSSNTEGVASVYVKDNYAYTTAWSAGLRIFDVSTPASPTEFGYFETEGDAKMVCVANNYAYLTDSDVGLRIIDVSTPSSPAEVGFYNTGSFATGVYVKNNYAYVADGEDGMYIIQNDLAPEPPVKNETKLTASDGETEDTFGRSVAIDGEYAVIGSTYDDNENGADAGSAYIFKYESNDWTEQQKIIASDGAAEDLFGYVVGINGDYIVVGAPWDDENGEKSGAAYIFKCNENIWTQQAKITASDGGEDNRFGINVAISGDNVIVGAFFDDDFGTRSGSAYIFKREGTNWDEQQILLAGDGAEGDWFGVSVSINSDYAVVGSRYNDNDNGADAGAVYIFKREGTDWLELQKLTASDGEAGDLFHVNSIYDDYIVVGAYQDDDNGDNSGSIYIFQRDETVWNEMEKHIASDGEAGELFGGSVVINGNRLVVSAYRDNDNGSNSGSMYLFQYDGVSWNEQEKIIAGNGDAGDYFGLPVDLNRNHILTGARNDDDNGENAGAAYLYELRLDPKTIYVPAEYSTITAALAVANYGDTILVAPDTYPESIIMRAGVTLLSETGPEETIIARNEVDYLVYGAPDAVIKGFTIADNDNGEGFPGSGILSDGDNTTICYCIIKNNRGGIYLNNNSQAIVYNNTIDNNSLAGIYMQIEPAPEIYNNIISNGENGIFRNTAHSLGDPFIQYNCYYENGEHFGYYGDPWIPEPGVGKLFGDPLFVGGLPFDYNLTTNSPCIDKGDPASPLDPDGTRADMGALYYSQTTVDTDYNWPMINGNKERNSWAKSENDLYPPFSYSYIYPVAGKTATNISFFDKTLYIGAEGTPNTVYAYDFGSATQLWNFEIPGTWGAIGCTPAVNDSLVLCGGQDGLGLYALDRLTGAQRWLTEIGSLYLKNPVVDDDLIYIVKDTLRCIYVEDGLKRWSFYLPESKGTPTVDQEFVYFVGHNHLMKIYKRTGAIRSSIANKGYTIVVDNLSRYTCSTDSIISREKATGARNWYYKISGVEAAGVGNIIAIDNNYLCVSVWATGELYVLDKSTGSYLWHYAFSDVGVSTPTIANGVVYVVNGDPHEGGPGTLWGFDIESGNNLFYDNSEDYRGQPIVANHTLFVPAAGKVKAFRNMNVAVEQVSSLLSPENYSMLQNYPNPFNPKTNIQFAVKEPGRVVLKVYDLLGREIAKLTNEHYQAGKYQLKFDGSELPSGIYFYKIQIGDYSNVKKMVLLE